MRHVRPFSEFGADDVAIVGGKIASLGEMIRHLCAAGVPVPDGFALTVDAFRYFLRANHLDAFIARTLNKLDAADLAALARAGAAVRARIVASPWPEDLAQAITAAYRALGGSAVAVRSSATAEDLASASFAGQQDSFLNVRGEAALLDACRRVYASLYTDRAISYRAHQGIGETAMAVGVQRMVRADLAASGVMFTVDTETGFPDVVLINAAYGLGEGIVRGAVNPDEYYVFKTTLKRGAQPIVKRRRGDKQTRMVYGGDADAIRTVPVPEAERLRFALSDAEIMRLAGYALRIEAHYSARARAWTPMDIEWAKDGESGELYVVQARAETVRAREAADAYERYRLDESATPLARGVAIGRKIAAGRVRVLAGAGDSARLQPGEVLVAEMTDPDWEPAMRVAAAVVTDRGGRTCHAAIIAREIGIPAVVGCGDATRRLAAGAEVTVSCAEGATGFVYPGRLPFSVERVPLGAARRSRTRLMLNVGDPEQAFAHARLPNDGVGLARLEFIIARSIRAHPRALLEYERLAPDERHEVDLLTAGYPDRRAYFIMRLAEGVGTIAAAFYPRPVIVRFSDFKSNEYASLVGGGHFEPAEENPMIGLRGASRYYDPGFEASFAMECEAMKRVREAMGLDNVALMIPFVRSPKEARRVIDIMERNGLRRGERGLELYLMCEIPANALRADEFLPMFDGFSIGSNDLTQLTLGVDRDSGLLTGFDERDPAVLRLMELAIEAAHRHGKRIGICGQAPSDHPEITRWLVERGIDSISFNPDSVMDMTRIVLEAEAATGS